MTAPLHGPLPLPASIPIPPPPAERYRIAVPTSAADRGYIVRTWVNSFHRAKANHKRTFRSGWKEHTKATIDRIIEAPGTGVLCAYHERERVVRDGMDLGPAVIGWIVWSTGRGWPTVHYVYVRHDELGGAPWRRRGVMTELLEAAELGDRIVYTHRGEYRRGLGGTGSRQFLPRPLDEEIADWLRARGMTVSYVPIGEWLA